MILVSEHKSFDYLTQVMECTYITQNITRNKLYTRWTKIDNNN